MKRSRFTEEQIIGILKGHNAGVPVSDWCRKHGVGVASIYEWKAKFAGMDVCEVKKLRGLFFNNLAKRGRTTMGCFFGFKLHILISLLDLATPTAITNVRTWRS